MEKIQDLRLPASVIQVSTQIYRVLMVVHQNKRLKPHIKSPKHCSITHELLCYSTNLASSSVNVAEKMKNELWTK